MTDWYHRPIGELAREKAQEVQRLVADVRGSRFLTARHVLVTLGAVAVIYGIAFASQSRSAEQFCLKKRHASSFYVSPWTLTRYCTYRGVTLEAGDAQ